MTIENITDAHGMQDIANGTWLSIFDGRDFYRVNVQDSWKDSKNINVYDFNNDKVLNEDIINDMVIETIKYFKELNNEETTTK